MQYPPPPAGPPPPPSIGASPDATPHSSHEETELIRAYPAATPRVWLLWLATAGIYEFFRRRTQFVVTNHRVLVRHGLINRTERSLPLARIQDISTTKHPLTGTILLSTAGGTAGIEEFGPLWNGTVDRMAQVIRDQIAP